jgi:AraC-like DNA-binding protein
MSELDALLTMIERYVALCCSLETPPRVSELAQFIGVSACTLGRYARSHYDVALCKALKDAQLSRAKRMLRFTEVSTTRIAYACGFGTRRTFFRAFQRAVGMTPAQYREVIRESPGPGLD